MAKRITFLSLGTAFIILGIFIASRGISTLIEHFGRIDWIISSATVTEAEIRQEGNNFVSDIVYEYSDGTEVYTVEKIGDKNIQWVGNMFPIVYNPQSPDKHTDDIYLPENRLKIIFAAALWNTALGIFLLIKSRNTTTR